PDGFRKATFAGDVIFIQQFQLFRQQTQEWLRDEKPPSQAANAMPHLSKSPPLDPRRTLLVKCINLPLANQHIKGSGLELGVLNSIPMRQNDDIELTGCIQRSVKFLTRLCIFRNFGWIRAFFRYF
ncbi:MAG TPA: hypothetical protein VN284_11025, partial [Rhizobium sp.]|nr:hypothetical protein [Rhizobium sp.]